MTKNRADKFYNLLTLFFYLIIILHYETVVFLLCWSSNMNPNIPETKEIAEIV